MELKDYIFELLKHLIDACDIAAIVGFVCSMFCFLGFLEAKGKNLSTK